ncbi:zinc finger BED domain-containing protein 5-like [Watersipora subatra]|uniref:zinc finger BED domain-containing protein 5-like n=1 Tax=Watersipora subatra TaxID=2589382 RepID=UPI00355B58B0
MAEIGKGSETKIASIALSNNAVQRRIGKLCEGMKAQGKGKEEFLLCTSLQTTTKVADVLRAVEVFFKAGNLDWAKLCGCCTSYVVAVRMVPQGTLDEIIQIVNFIKESALNSRLFKQLCGGMDASHQVLLYHSEVRWLSKGNVTERVFELRDELKLFFQE